MSVHVSSREWSEYYRQYAREFKLYDHIEFNTTVKVIRRNEKELKWMVYLEGEESPRVFDKVVFSSGSETVAKPPRIENLDEFEGEFLHGQAYKR